MERECYLDELKSVKGVTDIIALFGCRGSGKSTLLKSFIDFLHKTDPNANAIFVDFDDPAFNYLKQPHALHNYVESCWKDGKNNYLLIDEVQSDTSFIQTLSSLHCLEKYDIYVTGSSDYLFEDKMATLLTGRIYDISLYPFSLREYMNYFKLSDSQKALDLYLKEGGFAAACSCSISDDKSEGVDSPLDSVFLEYQKRHPRKQSQRKFEALADFLLKNAGKPVSIEEMITALQEKRIAANKRTIKNLLADLKHIFAFVQVDFKDPDQRYAIFNQAKYYPIDPALFTARVENSIEPIQILETVVALELLRRGFRVYTGIVKGNSVTFIADNLEEWIYIQVVEELKDSEQIKKLAKPLLQADPEDRKLILTCSSQPSFPEEDMFEGIEILDLAKWLITFPQNESQADPDEENFKLCK